MLSNCSTLLLAILSMSLIIELLFVGVCLAVWTMVRLWGLICDHVEEALIDFHFYSQKKLKNSKSERGE